MRNTTVNYHHASTSVFQYVFEIVKGERINSLGPQGLLVLKHDRFRKFNASQIRKNTLAVTLTVFSKWLTEPHHSAHTISIEILCRNPISMSPDLFPGRISFRTNSSYTCLDNMPTRCSKCMWNETPNRVRPVESN